MGARERLSVGQEHVHVRGKEVLLWLRANGCPWDEETCTCAAEGGHLEVLQWARANGCPWDRQTRQIASGHILEWVVANGLPYE